MTTQQDERAAFEAEYRLMFPVSSADPKKFEQNGTGGYEDFQVNNAWRFWQARAQSHREALAQHRAALEECVEALEFYAGGSHFTMHDPDAWDTVSGEPQNFYEDENNTATVEDGSIAKAAITHANQVLGKEGA